MALTIPSDANVPGNTGHVTDHNNMADVLTLNTVTNGINVLNTAWSGGADPTGVNDSSAAFTAAIAALPSGGGNIIVPAGSYKLNSGITFHQDQGMTGAGSACTSLYYHGSGTAITVSNSVTFTGGQYAGKFSGFYLDGYSAGASAVGVQIQDLQGITVDDAAIYGFGGKGIYYVHSSGWAEQSTVRARIVQCGTYGSNTTGAVVFSGTSFDYGNYDFTIVTLPGTHGIVLRDSAQLRGAKLRIRGNFYARASANTGAVIAIDPDNNTGGIGNGSYITDSQCDVSVEVAGSGGQIGHTFVLFGSTSAASQFTGGGTLSFNPNGNVQIFSQGFSNPNTCPFGFSGWIQDGTAAGPPFTGDGFGAQGGVAYNPNGHLNSRPGGGLDVYFTFGDIVEGQLTNGNNSLIFHGGDSGGWVRRSDLWLAQPATGATGTVTWPSGTKWPGGSAPTLSTANSAVDHLRFTWLPDTAAWYGELVGKTYS